MNPRVLKLAAVSLVFLLASCQTTKVSQEEMDAVNYGPQPAHWKEEIQSYLKLRLKDPTNAIVEFKTEPKQMFQKQVGLDPQVHGWAVCVWIRDRNKAGQWQDTFPMTVFLRNEKIVHVNNPPDGYGPAGPLYAREQCKTLGAPFKDK
jgi:hypothetical protein